MKKLNIFSGIYENCLGKQSRLYAHIFVTTSNMWMLQKQPLGDALENPYSQNREKQLKKCMGWSFSKTAGCNWRIGIP